MNEKITTLKNQLDQKIKKLNDKRNEINFLNLLDIKTQLNEKLVAQYQMINHIETDQPDVIEQINQRITKIKAEKEANNNQLGKVQIEEIELFKLQTKIEKLIHIVEKKYNKKNVNYFKNKNKLDSWSEDIIKKNNPDILKNEMEEIEYKITKTNRIIEKRKAEKQPYSNFNFDLNNLKLEKRILNRKKSRIKNINEEHLKVKLNLLTQENFKIQTEIKKIHRNILELTELVNQVKSALKITKENTEKYSFVVKDLNIYFGKLKVVDNLKIKIPKKRIVAIIGDSKSGKSAFLKSLNRINDGKTDFKVDGKILFEGKYDIYKLNSIWNKYDKIDFLTFKTKIGVILDQPNPFKTSIYKNVSSGPKLNGITNKIILNEIVKNSLETTKLWDEVKNNLKIDGTSLSNFQQQRLCLARAIASEPEVILMDEPTKNLNRLDTKKIEEIIFNLKRKYTIVLATNSIEQAKKLSDYIAVFDNGRLIEYGRTKQIFNEPKEEKTRILLTINNA